MNPSSTHRPTVSEVRRLFDYNPITGHLSWTEAANVSGRKKVGVPFRTLDPDGYVVINLHNRRVIAAHLAWAHYYGVWPEHEVDHENGNGANNSITNLRAADSSQNKCNQGRSAKNTSGFKGVSFHRPSGLWRAEIAFRRKRRSLGYHKSPEQAHAAYVRAAEELHGKFARTE